jgi:hypothetical protein
VAARWSSGSPRARRFAGHPPGSGELLDESPLLPAAGKWDPMGQDREPGIPKWFQGGVVHSGLDQDDVIRLKRAAPVDQVGHVALEWVAPLDRTQAEVDEEHSGIAERSESSRLFVSLAWVTEDHCGDVPEQRVLGGNGVEVEVPISRGRRRFSDEEAANAVRSPAGGCCCMRLLSMVGAHEAPW